MTFTAIGDIYINWVSSPHQDSALSVFLKSSAAIERAVAITNEKEWDPLWKAGQVKLSIHFSNESRYTCYMEMWIGQSTMTEKLTQCVLKLTMLSEVKQRTTLLFFCVYVLKTT